MNPIRVVVRRGGVVEAVHRVHAVAVRDRDVVATRGDRELVVFMRSAAKPLQALPVARARADLDDRELAIACASHLARAEQLDTVRSLLAKAPAAQDALECGPAGDPPRAINHNCSGKHAAMLALCRVRGWPTEGYRLAEHPCQRAMLAEVAAAAELPDHAVATAVDGCGVITFALPLERMALAFSRLEQLDGGERVARAMRAYPELLRGPGAADVRLMQARPGWAAKGGAEGLLCAAGAGGLGIALKVEDGNMRAICPALAAFLADLTQPVDELAITAVENSLGERVGEVLAE